MDQSAHGRRTMAGWSVFLLVLGLNVPTAAQETPAIKLSESAIGQIEALLAEKDARTPAQQKIDSQFIYATRMRAGSAIASGVQALDLDVKVDLLGRTDIDVRIAVDDGSIALVKSMGGDIQGVSVAGNSILARFPIDSIERLATDPRVRAVARPLGATTNQVVADTATADTAPSARAQRVIGNVVRGAKALGVETSAFSYGGEIRAAIPEGDVAHGARAARAAFGLDGSGLRVCVLSDSFARRSAGAELANDIASGDLPGVGNPNGRILPVQFAGSGEYAGASTVNDEGRAMLQIVHAILPGAQLYFATAFNSIADFANNIAAMGGLNTFRGAAVTGTVLSPGCHIIVDDIFYFAESGLHDGQATGVTSSNNMGIVTQAVNDVTAAGVLYFSSAGNSGNLSDGTSGAWEGDFTTPGGAIPVGIAGTGDALLWNGVDVGNTISGTSTSSIIMQWSDPLGGASNDYDLFRLNATLTTVQASSTNVQNGAQDPLEAVSQAAGSRLVVVRRTGAAPRFISLTTNRGRLQYATSGQVRGHAGAANAFGTAATPTSPGNGGPFPGRFVGGNVVETFSSDGPRRVFFNASNAAITPGNFLAATSGGLLRQKTDITAADGAPTSVPGFERFFGTSAAAPHAAAISGLVREAFVKNGVASPTPTQIRNALTTTALDIEAAGVDRDAGAGILQAFQAVQSTGLPSGAGLVQGTVTAVERPGAGNGDSIIDPGDQGNLTIALDNVGTASATGISATLTTATAGVTILNATRSYADIAAGGSGSNALPFVIYLAPTFACAGTIDFVLTVSYGGGVAGRSPQTFRFRVAAGVTDTSLTTQLDAVAPPASNNYVAAAVSQTGRLLGTGTASTCAAPKANPGLSPNGPTLARKVDSYTFQNPGPARCVSVTLGFPVTNGSNFVGSAAYSTYTPATPTNGYIADLGSSFVSTAAPPGSGSAAYSFTAPAGAPFTLTVVEATSGGVPASPADQNTYTLAVSGLAVCKAPTATTTITSISPAGSQTVGVPYTVNATVSYGTSPTGTITVSDGTASCTITLPATGCNLTSTTVGTKTITATYNGDANNSANSAVPPATYVISGPPNLAYAPAVGATVAFTGVNTLGSTGTGTIVVTPSGGAGSGGASTSTVNGCVVSGTDAASFAGAGAVNLSFVGATTATQNIGLTCVAGSSVRSATLSCNETVGAGNPVVQRSWPLSCPIGCSLDINGDGAVTPEKDAMLLARYLLGLRGNGLIANIPLGISRPDAAAVESYIGTGAQFDVFGRPVAASTAMQDGIVLFRLMLGVPDAALLGGIAVPAGATFSLPGDVRNHVNTICGTTF